MVILMFPQKGFTMMHPQTLKSNILRVKYLFYLNSGGCDRVSTTEGPELNDGPRNLPVIIGAVVGFVMLAIIVCAAIYVIKKEQENRKIR